MEGAAIRPIHAEASSRAARISESLSVSGVVLTLAEMGEEVVLFPSSIGARNRLGSRARWTSVQQSRRTAIMARNLFTKSGYWLE